MVKWCRFAKPALFRWVLILAVASAVIVSPATAASGARDVDVRYRSVVIEGIRIFYREAGPADAPVLLLLHGFPSSSHMYRDLIPRLATDYRVIAPDYPGYGYSDAPSPAAFSYSFDNLARIMNLFAEALRLRKYALYLQDFGGPVGFRMATAHPDRVAALIIQNANAYEEGLSPAMNAVRPAWQQRTSASEAKLRGFLTLEATRNQYLQGARNPERISPDAWTHDQAGLDRPGNDAIQLALLHDYGSNLKLYPAWQTYFSTRRPPTLVVWGRNDPFFTVAGANAYRRHLPAAEIHILDAGHFALEEEGPTIAEHILRFLKRVGFGR